MNGSITHRNVKEICRIENEFLKQRSTPARIADWISRTAGRMRFIVLHVALFFVWIAVNTALGPSLRFDPFPFQLLTTAVSLEAIFLSLFILMSQNRASQQADERNHLDLQINLLSEHENTKMLRMLQALCVHHKLDIAKDAEIDDLARRTEPREVLRELKDNLPGRE